MSSIKSIKNKIFGRVKEVIIKGKNNKTKTEISDKNKNTIFALGLTALVIGLLIFTGMNSAITTNMNFINPNPGDVYVPGDVVSFQINIAIPDIELVPVTGTNFKIIDPNGNSHACTLNLNGGSNINCGGYMLDVIVSNTCLYKNGTLNWNGTNYGYGYGYGYNNISNCQIKYIIRWNVPDCLSNPINGTYDVSAIVIASNGGTHSFPTESMLFKVDNSSCQPSICGSGSKNFNYTIRANGTESPPQLFGYTVTASGTEVYIDREWRYIREGPKKWSWKTKFKDEWREGSLCLSDSSYNLYDYDFSIDGYYKHLSVWKDNKCVYFKVKHKKYFHHLRIFITVYGKKEIKKEKTRGWHSTQTGSSSISALEGTKYISTYSGSIGSGRGDTVRVNPDTFYSVTVTNPNVNSWMNANKLYANTDYTLPWSANQSGSCNVSDSDLPYKICAVSDLVAPNGNTIYSIYSITVDNITYLDPDQDNIIIGGYITSWMLGSELRANYSPPKAFIDSILPSPSSEGENVSFVGHITGVGNNYAIEWNFGDGNNAGGTLTPTHVYGDNGVYIVTLRVTDHNGCRGIDTLPLTVNNVPPSANAGLDQTVDAWDIVNFSGNFTDLGWLDTHTIKWNFGDGGNASGTLTPTHIYNDSGVYIVTLTVTDDDGGVGTDTLNVTVSCRCIPNPIGDANHDGCTDDEDLTILNSTWGSEFTWNDDTCDVVDYNTRISDFNCDGKVDIGDLVILQTHFRKQSACN